MAKLTYTDKTNRVAIVDRTQQATAEDFNEIKDSVNILYDGIDGLDTVSTTRFPVKISTTYINGPLYWDQPNNKLVSDIALEVPAGTIKVGETTDLSSSTGSLIVVDRVNDTTSYIVCSTFDDTGANAPTYLNLGAESVLGIQTDFSETITTNPLTFSITGTVVAPSVRQVNTVTFKTGAILTNVSAKFTDNATGEVIRYVPDKATYDAGIGGLTTILGNNLFDFISTAASSPGVFNLGVSPFIIQNSQVIDIEIQADSINILGLSGNPFMIADIQDGPYDDVPAAPGGSDTQMQYNNAGVLAGTANITYSGTSLDFDDNTPLRFGLGDDFTIVHNETDTLLVSNTGNLEFYNTDATGLIFFTLGTDTAATSFQVRDNSSVPLFEVFGDGKVTLNTLYPENVVGYIKNGETGFAERHISTGVFSATTIPLTATGIIYGAWWGKEGTRLYVTTADAYIYQYNLTVPYDITTATFTASNNFTDPNNSEGFTLWNDDGTVFYHGGRGYRAITLTSAWEISGIASDTGNISLSFQDPINMYNLRWNFDGTKVLGVGDSINQAQRQSFIEWECATPYDLTTTTQQDANIYPFPVGVPDGSLIVKGFDISPDGRRVYLSAPSTGIEYEVVLETAWDLSSGTLVHTVTRTSHTDILNYSMAPDASGMVSVTPAGLIVQKKYGLEVGGNIIVDGGNVGIGTNNPNAPLQFETSVANKKIVLWGTGDSDHEFFGFGISGVSLRYQVNSADSDHTFYAATGPSTSDELMRITGDGNIGIGTSNPHAPLQFENVSANRKIVLFETSNDDHKFIGFGVNSFILRYQVDNILSDHVFYAATSSTTSNELMRITGDGLVGIGNSNPQAPLEFAKVQAFKKIVLYGEDNDNEFYGFGVQGGRFIYQVDSVSADHVFFAATSSASSQELFKIAGSGNSVTIGAAGTGGRFAFTKSALDSSLGLYSGTSGGSASHVFYNSTPAIAADIIYDETNDNFSISTEAGVDLILATGSGANIGVNKPLPVSTLHISEGTTTSDSTTGTTFEQIGLGSAVTHYVRTNTGTVFSSGIDADDVYKISNDYALGVNTDIAINTEGNTDFKNTIATPYGGFGRLQNLILWSEDTANTTVWNAQAPQVVVTGDQATAPDGTLTADEWAYTGSIGLALRNFAISLNIGVTYTVSFWARALVSDRVVRFDLGDGGAADITVLVTDDLQRYSATMVAGAQNWLDITNNSAVAGTIYVWGFQVNEGTELLPYTRTEAVQVHGTGPESGLAINHSAIFSTIAAPNYSEGTLFYDDGDKALSYYNEDSNVTVGIGRDLLVRVQNDQGVTISSGEAVYINGSSGGLPTVKLARSDSSVTSQFAGIVTETLVLNGEIGYVSTFGLIEFLNTSAWSAGDELYLSSTVAGALTNVPPADPNHIVSVAHVVISDLITGSIQVHTPERIAPDVLYSSVYSPITAPTHTEGQLYYDTDDKSLAYQTSSDDVTINIGKEIVVPPQVFNDQGVAITNGQAVYVSGSTGEFPKVKLAQANAAATAMSVGLITEASIANGATGYCTTYGILRGFDTSTWANGDVLYLSPTVAGGLQNTAPVYPNKAIRIAHVINSAVDGKLWVTYPIEEIAVGSALVYKSHAISDQGAADVVYLAGYYDAPTADTTLTIGGTTTQTHGTALGAYAAHAFCVFGNTGDGSLVLTVSGTSITDAGVMTPGDSEDIYSGISAVNDYWETSKKWLGQITYTLTGTTGSYDFNYGFAKYDDYGNQVFTIEEFEMVFKSGVNATGQNIEIKHHRSANWVYSAAAFVPGPSDSVISMATDYGTNTSIFTDEYFPYKRSGLSTAVDGTASEGVIIKVTQSTNNSTDFGTAHIGVRI